MLENVRSAPEFPWSNTFSITSAFAAFPGALVLPPKPPHHTLPNYNLTKQTLQSQQHPTPHNEKKTILGIRFRMAEISFVTISQA
ncbi:hypothetical protein HBI29_200440 [Parastagonospora nodorum]|nr:hypothetical protein HBI33_182240 [Parastagonospora nodorum]KAH5409130.1 hypothetical protein HBI47_167070 [Parastagonospora nodorum]KAH5491281.1 hypothetical protein HBI29_200440 [Parastagonospora nodorum]KAH5655490.1 hypothetical protein HBI51_046790 [Parastagonospora nodorum]